jgi:hypothetical protein
VSRHLCTFWPLLFIFSLLPVQALDEAPLDGYSAQNSMRMMCAELSGRSQSGHDRRVIRGNASKPESKLKIRSIPFCSMTDRCTALRADSWFRVA